MTLTAPQIDSTTWRKDTILPVGRGYGVRSGKPTAIVIHTTNNSRRDTAFRGEAEWLQKSVAVSSHYLVGKAGQIAQILHPDLEAWHAGGKQQDGTWTAQAAFANDHSIGIEAHVSVGEAWTTEQRRALTWLCKWLMSLYAIDASMVETHRKVALPVGRKTDPEGWLDADFYAWRATLTTPPPVSLPPTRYRVRVRISQRQEGGPPYAGELSAGDVVEIDKTYSNGYGHLKDGRGFVPLNMLEALQ
jgi:hypothetical protein